MRPLIDAILFDMGGTLSCSTRRDEAGKLTLVAQIQDMVGSQAPPAEFAEQVAGRARAYRRWSDLQHIELDEERLWVEWLLPEFPPDRLAPQAERLTLLWRQALHIRQVAPETKEILLELFRRGYRLGLISNTTSSVETPGVWEELEIAGIFESMLLSCQYGRRKPDPTMLLEAARQMELPPGRCAYVGNRTDHDVAAARQAGFGQAIVVRRGPNPPAPQDDPFRPDHLITDLAQLLDLFPRRDQKAAWPGNPEESGVKSEAAAWNASLSTMWAIHNFPRLDDFYLAARKLGFSGVELNHQVTPAMLDGARPDGLRITSVHEPCPTDVSITELKGRDWLISSTDKDCRQQGVQAVKRSIDLAEMLNAGTVIVHSGNVHPDLTLERKLAALWKAGRAGCDEYQEIKDRLVAFKQALLHPRLDSARRSLLELLDYAWVRGIRLGLENRNHFLDLPGLDEMGALLDLADAERIGFIFDTGHARALENLGFYSIEDWLRRYAGRLYGVHLHDIHNMADHDVPGSGDIDFALVASYLPPDAFRTLELKSGTSAVQIRAGMKYLQAKGCVTCLPTKNQRT